MRGWQVAFLLTVLLTAAVRGERVLHISARPIEGVRLTAQLRSLEEAMRIARAGDRIVLHDAVHHEPARLLRGGRRDAPIILEPAEPGRGRLAPTGDDAPLEIIGDHVHLRGLHFERPVIVRGNHARIENCTFTSARLGLLITGADAIVRGCTFEHNRQIALAAKQADRLLVSDCTIRAVGAPPVSTAPTTGSITQSSVDAARDPAPADHAPPHAHPRANSAAADGMDIIAGVRISRSRGAIIEHSRIEDGRGIGIRIDDASESATIRHCLIRNNATGILADAARAVHAHDNVIAGNGLGAGDEKTHPDGGLVLSSTDSGVIERNLIAFNRLGLVLHDRPRQIIPPGETRPSWIWMRKLKIQRNLITFNRAGQLWGWFDVPDERHWPRRMQGRPADAVKLTETGPVGLSLEALNLHLSDNLYAQHPGDPFGTWGAPARRHRRYPTLGMFRADLDLEHGSLVIAAPFADAAALDFRLPSDHLALLLHAYPDGTIPGVRLGTTANSAVHTGSKGQQ